MKRKSPQRRNIKQKKSQSKFNKLNLLILFIYMGFNIGLTALYGFAVGYNFIRMLTIGYIFKYQTVAFVCSFVYAIINFVVWLPIIIVPNFIVLSIYNLLTVRIPNIYHSLMRRLSKSVFQKLYVKYNH